MSTATSPKVSEKQFMDAFHAIKAEKGFINPTDKIYFSFFLLDEIECNWQKLHAFILDNNLKNRFCDKIADADVVVIDAVVYHKLVEGFNAASDKKSFDTTCYKYWEEITEANKLGKRIVDFTDWNIEFHSRLTEIDDKMFENLSRMLKSKEDQTVEMAVSIISATNRKDPTTVAHLNTLIAMINESKLKSTTEYRELVSFLAKVAL